MNIGFCTLLVYTKPAKRLCDASSVLVGVELPISSRFQPSPLASKLLAASRKGEHCASVSPCQYIAYPQQVLCSAFSRRQVLLGTVRPQHWICKGEFVWPNGEVGGWGQEKSQQLLRWRRSYKTFPGANVYTQTHCGRRVLVDEAAGQICLQASNTNRRQQLLGSEDSLGHQQGAEDAEWPSLARVEGTRQPWLATSLEEGKLQTENQVAAGASPDLLEGRKTQRKTGFKGIPSWALPPKAENSGPCGVGYPQNRLFTHLRHYGRATIFGTVWCCPSGL